MEMVGLVHSDHYILGQWRSFCNFVSAQHRSGFYFNQHVIQVQTKELIRFK